MLASASPRRRQLLEKAGLGHRVFEAGFEDASMRLSPTATPAFRVMALAWAKAVAARDRLEREAGLEPGEAILAADTLCELDGRILGKPRDATAAARMIRSLADRAHRTLTAICLLDPVRDRRLLWVEAARVDLGPLEEAEVERYANSQAWRGKAGGYSLDERRAAGWAIRCEGDPEVVLGLPTASVARRLRELADEAPR